jgi:hypothetical protein
MTLPGGRGTAPQFEINYGAVAETQLHVIAPLAFLREEPGSSRHGYGDTELGVKRRLVRETATAPQIGVFPLVEIPTGDEQRGLGSGHWQVFLPVRVQKEAGAWSTYGGGGYWINPGRGNTNWWFLGGQLQRRLTPSSAVGAEIFHTTPNEDDGVSETRFNAGLVIDLSAKDHLLLSAGRGLHGPNVFQGYVAYQLTLGP